MRAEGKVTKGSAARQGTHGRQYHQISRLWRALKHTSAQRPFPLAIQGQEAVTEFSPFCYSECDACIFAIYILISIELLWNVAFSPSYGEAIFPLWSWLIFCVLCVRFSPCTATEHQLIASVGTGGLQRRAPITHTFCISRIYLIFCEPQLQPHHNTNTFNISHYTITSPTVTSPHILSPLHTTQYLIRCLSITHTASAHRVLPHCLTHWLSNS